MATRHLRAGAWNRAVLATAVLLSVPAPAQAVAAGTDPLLSQQYGLELSGLAAAGEARERGDGTVVAVIDTGVDLDHPDLVGRLVPGRDFVDGDTRPDDGNGHGTHVAGIIAATSGNGIGIAGGAPGAKIMPVRVLGSDGTGDTEVIADAVRWAVGHGADVINLSLDDTGPADRLRKGGPLARALREASDQAVVVAAAGNEGHAERLYRAGVPAVVVQAVGADGQPAPFTNFGDPRSVAAPGVDIVSTVPGGYARKSGTSMAAPHVAAEAALLIGAGADPATARELITTTAHDTDDPLLGAGLIDAAAALGALEEPDAPEALTPSPRINGSAAPAAPAASESPLPGTGTSDADSGGAALLGLSFVTAAGLLTVVSLLLLRTRTRTRPNHPRPRHH